MPRPGQQRAWSRVHRAVRRGDLEPTPCAKCGAVPSRAHHPDYDRPLDVVWLCHGCHKAEHATMALPALTRRPHPIVLVLREQGRTQTWLARRIGRTPQHVNRVLHGLHPATADLRATCARALGMDEADLFLADHDASGADGLGDGTAKADRLYPAAGGAAIGHSA